MVREVTMEVVSLEDAIEMSADGKIIDYEITENGYKCNFLMEQVQGTIKKQIEEAIISCQTIHGEMFLSAQGTTFEKSAAKIFPLTQAKQKTFFMNKNGRYNWKWEKV